jgi:hypothetical protein
MRNNPMKTDMKTEVKKVSLLAQIVKNKMELGKFQCKCCRAIG